MNSFYVRFDQKCKERGTSMTAVLKKLGIPTSNMGNWKSGGCPREGDLKLIADELHCTMAYLRWGENEKAPASHEELAGVAGELSEWDMRFLEELKGLPNEGKVRLLEQIELLKLKYREGNRQ